MLVNGQLKNVQFEHLPADPDPADSYESRPYYNTVDKQVRIFLDGVWGPLGSGGSGGEVIVDTFSGDGTTATFTLSEEPISENALDVFVSGVYFQKSRYSVSGTTLTFTTVPPTGTNNVEVLINASISIGEPGDNTVSTEKIVDGAVTQEKLSEEISSLVVEATTQTASFTITNNSSVYQRVDATAADITVIIPTPVSTFVGRRIVLHKVDSTFNLVTLSGGLSGVQLSTENEKLEILNTGAEWILLSRDIPSNWNSFTPTIGITNNLTSNHGFWKRTGDGVLIRSMQVYSGSSLNTEYSVGPVPDMPAIDFGNVDKEFNTFNYGTTASQNRGARPVVGTGYYSGSSGRQTFALIYNTSFVATFGIHVPGGFTGFAPTGGKIMGTALDGGDATISFTTTALPILGWDV